MPYQLQGPPPIPSPWFFEPPVPYPHWYRYGPDYSRTMFRSESSEGAWVRQPTVVLGGLGADPALPTAGRTVPWQCWDAPGFKACQTSCYDKANKEGKTDAEKQGIVEACFWGSCVTPCEQGLATEGGGASSATSWMTSLSPKTLALGAVGVAVLLALLKRRKVVAVRRNPKGRPRRRKRCA